VTQQTSRLPRQVTPQVKGFYRLYL